MHVRGVCRGVGPLDPDPDVDADCACRDETEDIRGFVDEEVEGAKTSFQMAWERAQAKAKAGV